MTGNERTGLVPILTDFRPFSLQLACLVLLLGEISFKLVLAVLLVKYLYAAVKQGDRRQIAAVLCVTSPIFLMFIYGEETTDLQVELISFLFAGMFISFFAYSITRAVIRKRFAEALMTSAAMASLVILIASIGHKVAG